MAGEDERTQAEANETAKARATDPPSLDGDNSEEDPTDDAEAQTLDERDEGANTTEDIWRKVNYDLLQQEAEESEQASDWQKPDWLERWGRIRPFVDLIASVFWVYAVLQIFVLDVDRTVLGWISPGAEGLGNFRVLFVLALLAAAALLGGRNRPLAMVGYVIAFPVIVLFWKIPKALIKSRSVVAFLAVVNVAVEFGYNWRHLVVVWALWAIAAVVVLSAHSEALLGPAMLVLAGLLLDSFWRTIRFAIRPGRFLEVQSTMIDRVMDSDQMLALAAPSEELRHDSVRVFDKEQQLAFTQHLANGVIAFRGLGFWADQLDRYRRSPFSILFNFAGYVVLLVDTFATLTLVNWSLYKIDPGSFTYDITPSLIDFGRYVLASFGGSEITALQAHSDLAGLISIISTLIAVIFIFGLVLTGYMAIRQGRQDEAAKETIARIDRQGELLQERLEAEYGVTVEEAIERLKELRFAFLGLITFLAARTKRRPPGS
jgi:hypothetical protein